MVVAAGAHLNRHKSAQLLDERHRLPLFQARPLHVRASTFTTPSLPPRLASMSSIVKTTTEEMIRRGAHHIRDRPLAHPLALDVPTSPQNSDLQTHLPIVKVVQCEEEACEGNPCWSYPKSTLGAPKYSRFSSL